MSAGYDGVWEDPDPEFPLKGAGERANAEHHDAIVREVICNTASDEGAHMQRKVTVLHDYDPMMREWRALGLENL
jgi:hypothetical protein